MKKGISEKELFEDYTGSTGSSDPGQPGYIWICRELSDLGLASALAPAFGNALNMVIVKLPSGYGDIPVSGIRNCETDRSVPVECFHGVCQGFMPLVGYNYASGNYKRMRKVSYFSWKTALIMSACFIICFCGLGSTDSSPVYPRRQILFIFFQTGKGVR